MLKSIWKDATFEVHSKEFSFPYKWKLSKLVIRGY
jgi:hypothetical protein